MYVLALSALIALFSRFLHHSFYGLFEDDFFYYALIARHIVVGHLSTFDGTHLTNGYHPLWMLVVITCYALFPGTGFFFAVEAVALIAILVFYFGVLRCLRAFAVPASLCRLSALTLSMHALLLFRYGMEVTLALPLGLWTLAYILAPAFRWTVRQTFLYGLLASLTVLARLDSLFLIALLIAAQTLTSTVPWSARLKRLATFCFGWFPFAIYLAINVHTFHALLPVSGAAKQLKPLWPPSFNPLRSLFLPPDRTKAAFVYLAVCVIATGAVVFLRQLRQSANSTRTGLLAALFLFPVVHYGVLCCLSDWTVWPWYYYSLSFALLAATAVLLTALPTPAEPAHTGPGSVRTAALALFALTLALAVYIVTYAVLKRPARKILVFVADFATQHPGTYAMGDGSGTPAFLADRPFIQLEGLTMDADYIRLVRTQTPLPDVLKRYHADYYVTFRVSPMAPCRLLNEPQQGGAHSPKLQGKVCTPPIAATSDENVAVEIYHASDVLPR